MYIYTVNIYIYRPMSSNLSLGAFKKKVLQLISPPNFCLVGGVTLHDPGTPSWVPGCQGAVNDQPPTSWHGVINNHSFMTRHIFLI